MLYEQIATALEKDTEGMTETWMLKVRESKSANLLAHLTNSQLRDHVPAMLQEMSQLIRSGGQNVAGHTREARADAHVRFQQQCGIGDLVEAIALLRMVVLDYLADVCSEPSLKMRINSYAGVARIVNAYLDEELRYASSLHVDENRSS
jgi:hypothetical protein